MEIKHEELGDLPLLSHIIDQSGLPGKLDEHFPVHGNWKAPSVGKLVKGWLLYIISECDHRLSPVESWAQSHLRTLRHLLECPDMEASAFQDDRLGNLLEHFSRGERYEVFQSDYQSSLLRLYDLEQDTVRVDSFNAPAYRDPGSLFQFGYHKSHQADMPHMKTMMATLDPMAMPVAAYTVVGSQNDDILYIPTIEQARKSLKQNELLFVGDVKMGTLNNCAYIAQSGNYYLCPLSQAYYSKAEMLRALVQAQQDGAKLEDVLKPDGKGGKAEVFAQVHELPLRQRTDAQGLFQWEERQVLVLSLSYAEAQRTALNDRLHKAQTELLERFIPRKYRVRWGPNKITEASAFVEKILKQHRVAHLLDVELVPPLPGRKDNSLGIHIHPKEQQIQDELLLCGWRLYISNASPERLNPAQMVTCYRQEFNIEHQFHRLLTKTTALLPIYLKDENRIAALVRLLVLALQFVTIIQFTARKSIQEQGQELVGLEGGNKNRSPKLPTAELILRQFKGVTIVWVRLPDQTLHTQITNLQSLHFQILRLLNCPQWIYEPFDCVSQNVNELA